MLLSLKAARNKRNRQRIDELIQALKHLNKEVAEYNRKVDYKLDDEYRPTLYIRGGIAYGQPESKSDNIREIRKVAKSTEETSEDK